MLQVCVCVNLPHQYKFWRFSSQLDVLFKSQLTAGWRRCIGCRVCIRHSPKQERYPNRVAKTHRIPYPYRSFPTEVTIVENDLQLRGSYESSPPCSGSLQEKGLQLQAENAFSPFCTIFDSELTLEKWPLGCNNGGGGGNFWEVKLFVEKWIRRRKLLFRRQNEKSVSQWDVRNAGTFSQAYFTHTTTDCPFFMHICRLPAPVHGLLKFARTFGFEAILGWWRLIVGIFPAILRFWDTTTNLLSFVLRFWAAFFKAHLVS